MLYPPSLRPIILTRAFQAPNGELGFLLSDAGAVLDACEADEVSVLGWELWLANHVWDSGADAVREAQGRWCGLIPGRNSTVPAVVHGSGPWGVIRQQVASLDVDALVDPRWTEHLRINFALDA